MNCASDAVGSARRSPENAKLVVGVVLAPDDALYGKPSGAFAITTNILSVILPLGNRIPREEIRGARIVKIFRPMP
jgi:hypothetical protein